MLTYKRKSEKEQTIDEALSKLTEMLHHQKADEVFWELAQNIQIVKTDVLQLESQYFFEQLIANQWTWTQLEQLADIWAQLDTDDTQNTQFKRKAKELLEFIQKESKSYSFEIAEKIERLNQYI